MFFSIPTPFFLAFWSFKTIQAYHDRFRNGKQLLPLKKNLSFFAVFMLFYYSSGNSAYKTTTSLKGLTKLN